MPDAARGSAPDAKPANPRRARSLHSRLGSWFDWWFRNRHTGRITVAQFPNVPLWIFFATVASRWFVPAASAARTVIDWVGAVALTWWALDEVVRGVNPWRRLLGLGGCVFAVAGLASLLR